MGVPTGSVVAILLRNEPAYLEALSCIRALQGVRVQIPWHFTATEIQPILSDIVPAVIIIHEDLWPLIAAWTSHHPQVYIAVVCTPEDIARIFALPKHCLNHKPVGALRWEELIAEAPQALPITGRPPPAISITSGSTGAPKIVRWNPTPRTAQWQPQHTLNQPAIVTSIVTAPMYHSAQHGMLTQAWLQRANLVILPAFDAEEFLAAIERYRVNHAYTVPSMFVRLLKLPRHVRERYDLSSLNFVFHAGAPCAANVKRAMLSWLGPVIWEAYGCSEAGTISFCPSAEWLQRPGTVGRPMRTVAILDDQHDILPCGATGQIWVDVRNGHEWVATGDVGHLDADGFLYLSGRADGLITTSQIKVYPAEIEQAILAHPAILDCTVFAVSDAECGQTIAAVVEMREPIANIEQELKGFLSGRISEYKIPVMIRESRASMWRDTGKLDRAAFAAVFQ